MFKTTATFITNFIMKTRFKKNAKVFDIVITALAGMVSVGVMLYAVFHFGLKESWPEVVLNMFYIACLVMIWRYFFNKIDSHKFNYWCSVFVGNLYHRHAHRCTIQLRHIH